MKSPKFSEMPYRRPAVAEVRAATDGHLEAFRNATDARGQADALRRWDRDAVQLETAGSIAGVRYQLDTRDPAAKAEREFLDDAAPDFVEQRLRFLQAVVSSPYRAGLEEIFGRHAFSIWASELASYDPVIADDRRAEAKLCRRYTELTAGIHVDFQGRSLTLPQLGGHYGDADRGVRRAAQEARFASLEGHREELDAIYDELVHLRDGIGRKMGRDGYVPLAYVLRRRAYDPGEVAAFRRQVREVVVPLASRIRARHAAAIGVTDYDYHDTFVRDLRGVPRPRGGHDWLLDRATRMFAELGPDFAEFWRIMRESELLDLETREGKAGGGFCTDLPAHGVPFVFANFNGTADDVDVFTHECGHAFQSWRSMAVQPLNDYCGPTADAAEIHSMGLEMLCHPHAELFFEDDAARYRTGHLEHAVLFLPYGCAVDEFQHEVYRQPDLSPAQRAELWRDLEAAYLPERHYRGMPHAEGGRFWQVQRHVYLYPFYYIDYCLAQTCALQFWRLARKERDTAMASYRRLCELGGSLPFTELVATVGLGSPFADGCLSGVAEDVERVLLG